MESIWRGRHRISVHNVLYLEEITQGAMGGTVLPVAKKSYEKAKIVKNDLTYEGKPNHNILPSITGPAKGLCRRLESNAVLQSQLDPMMSCLRLMAGGEHASSRSYCGRDIYSGRSQTTAFDSHAFDVVSRSNSLTACPQMQILSTPSWLQGCDYSASGKRQTECKDIWAPVSPLRPTTCPCFSCYSPVFC